MAKMDNKTTIPVVFSLLPNKTAATCKRFWEVILSVVAFEPGLPTRVMSDYERAMQSTLRTFFPQAVHNLIKYDEICLNLNFHLILQGCNFHFTEALKRNAETKGMSKKFSLIKKIKIK